MVETVQDVLAGDDVGVGADDLVELVVVPAAYVVCKDLGAACHLVGEVTPLLAQILGVLLLQVGRVLQELLAPIVFNQVVKPIHQTLTDIFLADRLLLFRIKIRLVTARRYLLTTVISIFNSIRDSSSSTRRHRAVRSDAFKLGVVPAEINNDHLTHALHIHLFCVDSYQTFVNLEGVSNSFENHRLQVCDLVGDDVLLLVVNVEDQEF